LARTSGPLLGLGASGTLADKLTSSSWKGRNYTKIKGNPKAIQTTQATSAKCLFGFLGGLGWSSLTSAQQAMWAAIANKKNTSPINEFIREGMSHILSPGGPTQEPGQTAGGVPPSPIFTPNAVGGVRQITVTYAQLAINDGWFDLVLLNSPTVAGGQTLTYPYHLLTPGIGTRNTMIEKVPPGTYAISLMTGTTTGLFTPRGTRTGVIVT
jgi:hypothetical protein